MAAAYQAAIGNIPAGSLFAALESARAVKYRVAGVNAAARASIVATEAVVALLSVMVRKEMEGLAERKAEASLVDQAKMLWNRNKHKMSVYSMEWIGCIKFDRAL